MLKYRRQIVIFIPEAIMQKRKLSTTGDIGPDDRNATPQTERLESEYDRQMRLMREIGKSDKKILAALAK